MEFTVKKNKRELRKEIYLMKKLSLVLAALAAFVLFAGCKNTPEAPVVQERAVFVYEPTDSLSKCEKWTFEDDGTYMMEDYDSSSTDKWHSGTYTGNASKDGTITITTLKIYRNGVPEDYTEDDAIEDIEITDGKFTYGDKVFTRQ